MKNLKLSKEMVARICVICLLSVSLSSCLKENKNQNYMPPAALVSFTQASPDQPIINFYLDANKVNAYPLNYGENLDYFQAFAGKRTANFYNAGTSNTILSDTVTFSPNMIYSLFLTGTTAKPEMVVVRDTPRSASLILAPMRLPFRWLCRAVRYWRQMKLISNIRRLRP